MATILAFAGSNSSTSINYQLVKYTASLLGQHKVQLINMHYLPFPMYGEDHEREHGFTNSLIELRDDILKSDGLIISVNEHNSNPSAFFKNLIDWLSRLERKFLQDKKIMLMATSKGKRGAMGSLEVVKNVLPRFGAEIVVTFSLPSFTDNFEEAKGILDVELALEHQQALNLFLEQLTSK
ncbi:MAG: NADPH-dependent oxidoreductase [Flavobacteriales bacterium]|nr:MAG: NADPH-dependent oxidoreductase [Flavobacteriales bacterium]